MNAVVVWGSCDPHSRNLLQQITQFLQGVMFRLADNTVNVIILVGRYCKINIKERPLHDHDFSRDIYMHRARAVGIAAISRIGSEQIAVHTL